MDVRTEIVDVRAEKCVFLRPRWWEKLFDPWAFGPDTLVCVCLLFVVGLGEGSGVEATVKLGIWGSTEGLHKKGPQRDSREVNEWTTPPRGVDRVSG